MSKKFKFKVTSARLIRDPNFFKEHGTQRHIFTIPAKQLPKDIGFDPNARNPEIRKQVYRKIEASLLQKDGAPLGTFHLKSKGITIIAKKVTELGGNSYEIELESGLHGIVDGGHTYTLITESQHREDLDNQQHVIVEVLVGIPEGWIPHIAGGLNTSVQVQDMSLDNLAGNFQWIKDELKSESYRGEIKWSENDQGAHDVRDIIRIMLCFNIELYPNDKNDHPILAYSGKNAALKKFEEKPRYFENMRPILKDVLKFHDIVSREARELYNANSRRAHGGALAFVESRSRGDHYFTFTGETDKYRLASGALYPMMAAFRWYVKRDDLDKGKMKWIRDFDHVLEAWRSLGADLMQATRQTSKDLAHNTQSIGKNKNHWLNCHSRVMKHFYNL